MIYNNRENTHALPFHPLLLLLPHVHVHDRGHDHGL